MDAPTSSERRTRHRIRSPKDIRAFFSLRTIRRRSGRANGSGDGGSFLETVSPLAAGIARVYRKEIRDLGQEPRLLGTIAFLLTFVATRGVTHTLLEASGGGGLAARRLWARDPPRIRSHRPPGARAAAPRDPVRYWRRARTRRVRADPQSRGRVLGAAGTREHRRCCHLRRSSSAGYARRRFLARRLARAATLAARIEL